MNELKERLKALGLGDEMTEKALGTIADFAKSKLPRAFHQPIDDVLAGKSPDLSGLLGTFGGFLK
jgi:hypothetical protein